MAFFLLTLPEEGGQNWRDDGRAMLVEADSAAAARQLAAGQYGDDQDWVDASVTAVDISSLSAADLAGFKYNLQIREPALGGAEGLVHEVEYVAVASDDFDDVGAELAALLQGAPVAAAIADDGGVFTDETTEANENTTGDVTLLPASAAADDAYYFGFATPFSDLKLVISQAITGTATITWEYWNGSAWTALTVAGAGADLETAGTQPVTFTAPSDWATTTVNSQGPFYFVRLVTDGAHTQQPLATRVHVGNKTNASYSTPTLTAAVGSGDDDLGDKSLVLKVTPPGGEAASMAGLVGAVTDEGLATADLTVALVNPTAVPKLLKLIK